MLNEENEVSMADLLKDYDVKKLNRGEILKGTIIEVNDKEASVNINYAFDGLISKEEVSVEGKDPREVLNVGDEIDVYVISPNDGEGYVQLSLIKAVQSVEKVAIKKAFENDEVVTVKVKEEVKGGVVAYLGTVRLFIPGSLVSRERIELSTVVGKELEVKIIELDFRNHRIIASRKIIEEAEYRKNQEAVWETLKEGEKRSGVVKKIVKFGAFVDIGGLEGLVHISDLSWKRVNNVEEIVKEGDKVEVFVGNIDKEKRRLSLILKDVDKEPWKIHGEELTEGNITEGTVTSIAPFGAFVELFEGIQGLVHISEIANKNIAKVSDVLEVGQKVKVKILKVSEEEKKISLSIRETEENNEEHVETKKKEYVETKSEEDENSGTSLADVFNDLKL